MELIGDSQSEPVTSPNSFIDNDFEEGNSFPWTMVNGREEGTNSYGRQTARIPPTLRAWSDNRGILARPTPVYPLNDRPELANFKHPQTSEPMEQELHGNMAQQQRTTHGNVPGFILYQMLFPLTKSGTTHETQQVPHPMQPTVKLCFPFKTTHSRNFLFIPAHEDKVSDSYPQ